MHNLIYRIYYFSFEKAKILKNKLYNKLGYWYCDYHKRYHSKKVTHYKLCSNDRFDICQEGVDLNVSYGVTKLESYKKVI